MTDDEIVTRLRLALAHPGPAYTLATGRFALDPAVAQALAEALLPLVKAMLNPQPDPAMGPRPAGSAAELVANVRAAVDEAAVLGPLCTIVGYLPIPQAPRWLLELAALLEAAEAKADERQHTAEQVWRDGYIRCAQLHGIHWLDLDPRHNPHHHEPEPPRKDAA